MTTKNSGLKLAAIHGYRPHMLGLCGPAEARRQKLLKKFLQGQVAPSKMPKVFRQFMGAYAYYRLIAKSNNIGDPFDKRVVEAYWMGNKLLDRVKINDLREMIAKDFVGSGLLSKEVAADKIAQIPTGSKPHHSFHVLIIGSVTGSVDFTGNTKLKDICRVGWGRVLRLVIPAPQLRDKLRRESNIYSSLSVKGGGEGFSSKPGSRVHRSGGAGKPGMTKQKVIVEYQPLIGKKNIKRGKPIKKEIYWDKLIAPKVKKGDWVSFHWNWLVKVLSARELANLKKYTQNTLESLNGQN